MEADESFYNSLAVEMLLKEDGYGFDELHKVIKDGRIVRCDPITKVWERKHPGVDRETWERYPSLRALIEEGYSD